MTTQSSATGVLAGLQNTEADAAKPDAARLSTGTASTSVTIVYSDDDDDEDDRYPYWEREDWVPTTKSGKQRTPNMIRNELQRYIDNSSETQTSIVHNKLKVNYSSFGKFMNPKYYKNQWSAIQNGTYWAAARFLEEERNKKQKQPKTAAAAHKKRAREGDNEDAATIKGSAKKSKKEIKAEAIQLMKKILNVEEVEENSVYDTCPQVVKKIKAFLAQDGVTKKDFCDLALGGVNSNSLNRFLAGKKQDQAGNIVYYKAYGFFEKKRVLENEAKSAARRKNETNEPDGFALEAPRKSKGFYVYCDPSLGYF